MPSWWRALRGGGLAEHSRDSLSERYQYCRQAIARNNEALELLAAVQDDLLYAPPCGDVIGGRVTAIFDEVRATIEALEQLSARRQPLLHAAVDRQQREIEEWLASRDRRPPGRLAVRLSDLTSKNASEVGAKAGVLAEIGNRLDIPVPAGYVMTTEAYERFWVLPQWRQVRDATRALDPADADAVSRVSRELRGALTRLPLPRSVEVALTERARLLDLGGLGLSVRSSAVGEGEARTFAGQLRSSINVQPCEVVAAYKSVLASRFSSRAMTYRLSLGLPEVDNPTAVLVTPTLPARAAGILYTRDPDDRSPEQLWVTARWGLGLDVTQGRDVDLFVVSRRRGHPVLERRIARKREEILPRPGGGLLRQRVTADRVEAPCLEPRHLARLAEWALRIEEHFRAAQDIEWVLDEHDHLWIVQARPLARAASATPRLRAPSESERVFAGGRTVFAGRASGPAFLAASIGDLRNAPPGAIVFLRRASPEIVRVFPRVAGLVAEWGNITGHAATLLREFQIPSFFEARGVFETVREGEVVSLDSGATSLYRGVAWPSASSRRNPAAERRGASREGVIGKRLLALTLVDPAAWSFRAASCQSAHDVLRFCHERAIAEMFALSDRELRRGNHRDKRLISSAPINVHVLDLGGGLCPDAGESADVRPEQIVSRPFQALWRGLSHPGVTWNRDMPASIGGLASVMGQAFSASQPSARRAIGAKSYLMVTRDYLNLNARLAFHFTLVDAVVSPVQGENAIAFRFAGGGATRLRRDLRACFIEACLSHYGFVVDRRGDLVNAWFKKAAAPDTEARLDIVGRLIACSSQLDMYMTDADVMQWYVRQFLAGNYGFKPEAAGAAVSPFTAP